MSIEYLGLSSINGPLIALEGVQDAFYDEIVEFVVNGEERKLGRIVEVYEDKAVIQVFEGSEKYVFEKYAYQTDRTPDGDCTFTGYARSYVQRNRTAH